MPWPDLHEALDAYGEHTTGGAAPCGLVSGGQVHPPGAVRAPTAPAPADTSDARSSRLPVSSASLLEGVPVAHRQVCFT
jgi:hypothetical protein